MSPMSVPSRRPLIVLVEDDDAVRRSLHLLIASRGYDVLAFPSGMQIPKQSEALRAACLITDLVIPEGDGLALLEDMRAAGWRGASILISGRLTDELAGRALAIGYDLVLPKPIGETVLLSAVARLLAARAEGQAAE